MTENLLTPSVIKLFGRVMNDLCFKYDPSTVVQGYNNLLQRQLFNGATSTMVTVTNCRVIFDGTSGVEVSPVFLDPPSSNHSITVSPAFSQNNPVVGLISGMQIHEASYESDDGETVSVLNPDLPPNAYSIVTNPSIYYEPWDSTCSITTCQGSFLVSVPLVIPASSLPSPSASTPTRGSRSNSKSKTVSTPSASTSRDAQSLVPISNITIVACVPLQTPNIARIYGFSFEGAYYGLPRPSLFLVHGPGAPGGSWFNNSTLEQAGVAAREWDFSGNQNPNDIVYWEYEKSDFSIRLDPEAGPFEQILLQMALRTGAEMADRATPRSGSGLDTRSGSGLDTRSGSGLDTRSGSGLRR
jgi:hypothetical protein